MGGFVDQSALHQRAQNGLVFGVGEGFQRLRALDLGELPEKRVDEKPDGVVAGRFPASGVEGGLPEVA